MKNDNLVRIICGLKKIWCKKWKAIFPIIYLLIVYVIWNIGKGYLPIFKYFSLPQFYKWIFGIFMIEMAIIGLVQIFILLGTPANCKKIEKDLMEIGFVDYKGKVPTLLSKMKDKNGIILEFYSSRIPFYEYEKYRAEIETAINIKIVSIDPGRDAQHVFIKAIASDITIPQKIMWDDSYIDMHDFILKLGESYIGEESFDLSIVPHVLIGGGSGSGKSVLIKLILMQCLKKDAVVYLADFKGGVDYPKIWHEKCSIIIEAHELKKMLEDILVIMEERRKQLVESGSTNISEYNCKTGSNLQRIIVACDEVAEVLDNTGLEKEEKSLIAQIESKFSTIARQGRAFGIHLIFATQRPDANVIKGQIKNNIGMRICGRADKILSQIVLDNSDAAERISQKDQGIFLTNTNVRFKAYYIDDNCLE